MSRRACSIVKRCALALGVAVVACAASVQAGELDAALRDRIDQFVESERQASGLPGIALAIVQEGQAVHVRGFGQDGRGNAITGDTPFPIGSLTKSFTALLVRQAIEAGQLEADAPVQRYLPWFRVADADASAGITLRHLLNQTSGFSRADGFDPLLKHSDASIEATARGLGAVSLIRPVGEDFEYSNLNFVLLGAVLQAVTGKPWQTLVQERVFRPLQMKHSHPDYDAARPAGMTAVHRMWFGWPMPDDVRLPPGFAPTGSLVSSANDMGRYLAMLLARGLGPDGAVVSPQGVAQLLAPAAPTFRFTGTSGELEFRYGEGWCVGPFGGAADARWHDGGLASFRAWMVLLPETRQAVVLMINANSELPVNDVNAVMSRLPIGVVKLLRGQPPPHGPGLRAAYLPLNAACALALMVSVALGWWAARARGAAGSVVLLAAAIVIMLALQVMGLSAKLLSTYAPDFASVVAAALSLLCFPAMLRAGASLKRLIARKGHAAPS